MQTTQMKSSFAGNAQALGATNGGRTVAFFKNIGKKAPAAAPAKVGTKQIKKVAAPVRKAATKVVKKAAPAPKKAASKGSSGVSWWLLQRRGDRPRPAPA